ncbi:hypothetical protein SAZ10_33100 [Mesorhizobium sp. BAC0120]|uniref:hypothetical protein n=1 Tax=Mesorhizobium sp. BAC0120 TaxID=3090670 RepID=UPI00298C31A1|nr:hypothetical protein [Mesorhizobium sp. BAC0120]MDW6026610.1 hypothetical protein [Mesorhizobium sp. BAC0120]
MSYFWWPAFAVEIQLVIWLRWMKLLTGGQAANVEAFGMVVEKIGAAQQAAVSLSQGKSADNVARRYRRKVRANLRRLSR